MNSKVTHIAAKSGYNRLLAMHHKSQGQSGTGYPTNQQLEKLMSQLVDAFTALGKQIAASGAADNSAHFAAIDAHLSKIDASQATDEATLSDQQAALQAFVDAAKGASSASGSAAPIGTPQPTQAPVTAPGSTAAAS